LFVQIRQNDAQCIFIFCNLRHAVCSDISGNGRIYFIVVAGNIGAQLSRPEAKGADIPLQMNEFTAFGETSPKVPVPCKLEGGI